MKYLKKIAKSLPDFAQVLNKKSESKVDTYSCDYINNNITGESEIFIGPKEEAPETATFIIEDDELIPEEKMEIYDDTERQIGYWFGKPLYRKSFNLGNISTSPYFSILNLDNIKITNFYGIASRTNEQGAITLPYVNDEIAYQVAVRIMKNNSGKLQFLFIFNSSTITIENVIMTIEYTKTTD